jgi:hypothetical protein
VEFSVADDTPAPPRRRRPARGRRRGGGPPREPSGDLIKRRLIALGIGAVVLVLLLFAIRGCLDARNERNFENYLRDLEALVGTSNQLSAEFFDRLQNPPESLTEFTTQLGSSRGTGEDLLRRTQGLDAPGDLDEAQEDLVLAFELRRDGLDSIAQQVPTALGDEGRLDAIRQITDDMRQFLASDVLYARAKAGIEEALAEEELPGEVPSSVFLPSVDPWLDELALTGVLTQAAGATGAAGDADRGTELSSTVLRPGNVPLTPDTLNTLGQTPTEIEIAVLNGGLVDEVDVPVGFEILGSTDTLEGEGTISRIKAGETASIALVIDGEIPSGEELTLNVTVFPVPGESIIDNNEATYQVIFE